MRLRRWYRHRFIDPYFPGVVELGLISMIGLIVNAYFL